MWGQLVSHSNRKSKTRRYANIRNKRVYDPETGQFKKMKITTRALRTLAHKGWEAFKE